MSSTRFTVATSGSWTSPNTNIWTERGVRVYSREVDSLSDHLGDFLGVFILARGAAI